MARKKAEEVVVEEPMNNDLVAEVQDMLNQAFKKKYSGGVLKTASDDQFTRKLIPTGMLPMDILFEGGIPKGRITTLYGAFSSGKSLIGLCAIKQCQNQGGVAALIDTERTFDSEWAERLGIDTNKLLMLPKEVETGEDALEVVEALVRTRKVDLVVIDSITALTPEKVRTNDLQDAQPATLARVMSKGLNKINTANHDTAILIVSQTRTNLGITFGSKETATGGNAVGFYSTMMCRMGKVGKATVEQKAFNADAVQITSKLTTGQFFKADLTKSKWTKPFKEIYFTWDLENASIDMPGFLLAQGLEYGLIQSGGAWYSMDMFDSDGVVADTVRWQGKGKMAQTMMDNPLAYKWLTDKICEQYGLDNIYYKEQLVAA